MTDSKPPPFNPDDFVIFTPYKAAMMNDPEMPPTQFYLVSVLEDKGDNFDFEILESGACALVEALAISACKKGQRIWFTSQPFGDTK
jgi:hypothetical protein